ncbi:MAG: hypothetical protein VB853_11700 [Pirellulales bacterium]
MQSAKGGNCPRPRGPLTGMPGRQKVEPLAEAAAAVEIHVKLRKLSQLRGGE